MEGENAEANFLPENTKAYQTCRGENKEPQDFVQTQTAPNATNIEPGVAGAQEEQDIKREETKEVVKEAESV